MIPILYESNETAFNNNGLCRLPDCISVLVTEERNGIYECDFEVPVTGKNFEYITLGRIVAVTHDDTGDVQYFDIVSYSKPINGIVTFHAVHISYRQSYITVKGSGINSLSGALTLLKSAATPSNPFNYYTDKTNTGYLAAADGIPKTVRSMLGGDEGSILDTYGGEYKWDRFNVSLLANRGINRNFNIRYGVNMKDFTDESDASETYSAVIPYWTDGSTTVVGDRQTSGATITGRGETVPLDVSDKFETKPTKAQVEAMGLSVLKAANSTLPAQTIKVSFVRLQDAAEFANFAPLLQCELCDTIGVIFPEYNLTGRFKIVKTVWDALRERFDSMELGTLSTTLAEALGISSGGGGGGGSGTEPDDYVIEQGTSGDWSYRTWNSGKIEAWASHSFGSQSGTSWASQYYKDLTYSLPSGLFSTAPMVIASSGNSSWAVYGASASTSSISLRAVRNASNAAAMTINFYCIKN